tara:strand:+ start:96 stop:602 length:507 start_codon:yes stop_codon:yes gene_type:complete
MRNTNDFYPTPQAILDVLVENLDWSKNTVIWEPCAGDGRLVDTFENHGYQVIAHDIISGNDFFDWSESPSIALVTNPPFKPIRQFIDHAFKIGISKMALVCPERLWACKKGKEQFMRHQPSRFVNLDWREDYLGKGGKADRALAISIWDGAINNKTKYEVWSKNGNAS